ncbi:MAG: aminotransferase class I/II-fold pyridoxal phosphate-dependent enzyme, partial [Pseudomonadota bacterium]
MMSYEALKRELSPTAAAVQFFNALPDSINLGQGREVDDPSGKIGDLLKADLKTSCKYNSAPGGEMELRESAAAWVERFMGIPATAAITFLIQQLGREGLGHAMKVAALKNDPDAIMILPDTRWPMVDEKLEDERLEIVEYKIQRKGMADEIADIIQSNGKKVASAYFNFPHNPTGMHITP